MNNRTWQVYGIGLLLLGLLLVFAIPFYTRHIPAALESSVQEHLRQQGMGWVRAEAEGRDITLSGNAPNPQAYQQTLQSVHGVAGVRNVIDHMTPRIISPYTMSLDWQQGRRLVAEGFLPDENSYQAIGKRVADTYGKNQTVGKLQLANGSPPGWTTMLDTLLVNIKQLDRAQVNITDRQLHISGKTSTSTIRNQFIAALSSLGKQGYTLDMHIVAGDAASQICQQKFNALLQTPISFASGDAHINQESYPLLRKLSETAMLCPKAHITIAGHTDNEGSEAQNLKLSEQRAQAVAAWLFQDGIETSRMEAVGYGSSHPLADNASEAGKAKNRRIEFIVQGN